MRALCGIIIAAIAACAALVIAVPCFGNPIFDGRIDSVELDANGDIRPIVMTE